MIPVHASASQNAASERIPTVLPHARSVPPDASSLRARSASPQASVSRIQLATVLAISARGPAGAKSWSPPSIVTIRFGTRVGERRRQRHPWRLVVAEREAERGDSGMRERVARRDDVRLIRMSAETVQHRGAADRSRAREMQDPVELAVLDPDPDALRWHLLLSRRGRLGWKFGHGEELEDLLPILDRGP